MTIRKETMIQREDGSQLRIVCQLVHNVFGDKSDTYCIDTFTLFRKSIKDDWNVLSDIPAAGYKKMSRAEYISNGKSPLMKKVKIFELLRASLKFREYLYSVLDLPQGYTIR